eukprot:TRINITY_DN6756_c0_g1_i1.p1 TRINITY_DN6756_c0_g1~~TRINITY_DN6756_c0_g1_i1.p1  ORF type:complete len:581 (+),score=193.27 TRINITY_DN6756_c0_g1_i1:108-1850(+)
MVEVRVDTVDNLSDFKDCFMAVRIGDHQKLSRLKDSRTFKFPTAASSHHVGKVELFRRVGHASIDVDPMNNELRLIRVDCKQGGMGGLNMSIDVKCDDVTKTGLQKASKKDSQKASKAKDYLMKHGLEVQLSEAMQSVLKALPENPAEFLANTLLERVKGRNNLLPPMKQAEELKAKALQKTAEEEAAAEFAAKQAPAKLDPLPAPASPQKQAKSAPPPPAPAMAEKPAAAEEPAEQAKSAPPPAPVPAPVEEKPAAAKAAASCQAFPSLPEAAWQKMWQQFRQAAEKKAAPAPAPAPTKPVTKPDSPVPMSATGYFRHFAACTSSTAAFSQIYARFPAKKAPSPAPAPAAPTPAAPAEAAPAAPAPAPQASGRKPFHRTASVGTWLATSRMGPNLHAKAGPAPVLPVSNTFEYHFVEAAAPAPAPEAPAPKEKLETAVHKIAAVVALAEAGEAAPAKATWMQRASTGTWLVPRVWSHTMMARGTAAAPQTVAATSAADTPPEAPPAPAAAPAPEPEAKTAPPAAVATPEPEAKAAPPAADVSNAPAEAPAAEEEVSEKQIAFQQTCSVGTWLMLPRVER